MKQNIIYIILLMIISIFTNSVYASLSIKPNIGGGVYNNTIEINLLTSDKNAKIFYYTDGEGRLDNQKEYKGIPIVIKESINLNYHAFIDIKNSTLVEETKYIINYPKNFSVNYNNGKIEVKNNSNETVNIGYWKIEANNIKYELFKNTFLKKGELYKLDYKAEELEKISFISPDNKVKIDYSIAKTIVKKEVSVKIEKIPEIIKEELALVKPEINIKEEKLIIEKENKSFLNNNQIQAFNSKQEKIEGGFNINEHLKTSIVDTKKDNKNILYLLIIIFSLGIIGKILFYLNSIGIIDIKILDKLKKID